MSPELISILVLVAMFVVATLRPVNIGILGFVAALVVGLAYTDLAGGEIAELFPGDLFVLLVGITLLFAIAQNNGTIDWIVSASVRAVGGRLVAIPWIMFAVAAVMTAVGAVSPGAVAILAPVALGVAARYRISQMLMGLMVVHGAQAGGFSPISVYGVIVNGVVARAGLETGPIFLFFASLVVNLVIAAVAFVVFGGRQLLRGGGTGATPALVGADAERADAGRGDAGRADAEPDARWTTTDDGARTAGAGEPAGAVAADAEQDAPARTREVTLTLVGLLALAVAAVGFDLDVGLTAFAVALVLALISPDGHRHAVNDVAWSVVVLVGGVLTYVEVMQEIGTIDYVGEAVASIGAPLVVALLLCYIGGIVSAFASSVAILGATIPLAVPFLQDGAVGAVAMIAALSVSSTVVDCSPLSTNGALVLANSVGVDRDVFFRRLMAYGAVVVAAAPPLIWLALVVPAS